MVGRLHVPIEEGEDAVEELVEGGDRLLCSLHLLLRGGNEVVGGGDHLGEGDDLPGQLGGLSPVSRLLHSGSGLSHPNQTKLQI